MSGLIPKRYNHIVDLGPNTVYGSGLGKTKAIIPRIVDWIDVLKLNNQADKLAALVRLRAEINRVEALLEYCLDFYGVNDSFIVEVNQYIVRLNYTANQVNKRK